MAATPYSSYSKNPIKSWVELTEVENEFDQKDEWVFRGQDTLAFPATSLERHCKNLNLSGVEVSDLEIKLIRDFARRYHLYGGSASPPRGHTLEWLALMQHYGTPTRLLDFTYSFFIGAFFAVETADTASAIWAINTKRLRAEVIQLITASVTNGKDRVAEYQRVRDAKPFRDLFMAETPMRFVYSANPIRLNERLTIQQGVFLLPGDVTVTFESNMRAIPNHDKNVVQIVIDSSCRLDVLRKLHRLGINRATLFPGLEGFARSLRTKSLILKDLPAQDVGMLKQV